MRLRRQESRVSSSRQTYFCESHLNFLRVKWLAVVSVIFVLVHHHIHQPIAAFLPFCRLWATETYRRARQNVASGVTGNLTETPER